MLSYLVALTGAALVAAAPAPATPVQPRALTIPSLVSATKVAITIEPNYQRDSCVTADHLVGGRALWLCRDTELLQDQNILQVDGFISSTASWSNQNASNLPDLVPIPPPSEQGQLNVTDPYTLQLTQYGGDPPSGAYFPETPSECGASGGSCSNGTRFAIWPDAPAYVTDVASDGTTTMYMYMTLTRQLKNIDTEPPTSLYKLVYTTGGDADALPEQTLIGQDFFPEGTYNYGAYGGFIGQLDGLLYLYGMANDGTVGLARVALADIEDSSKYQFYVGGLWVSTIPAIDDTAAEVYVGGAGGQGTFFYSELYAQYVLLAQVNGFGMVISASTSLLPEGPWTAAETLTYLDPGNDITYSFAAHPEMNTNPNQIYASYTQINYVHPDANRSTALGKEEFYAQPLYLLEFGL
ncbi:hypothetical protein BD324DRAFT_647649 [Kockovaella imperatae]|uniref:Uncharacterized protein n=1 Tax=Kockovaella imperatae TaxID=4999 RepID=A0A1Y1UT74_9TREE|nr:hypothetical protein BD324DRAFT_647649 [Kockovaella imperatae]ORX40734.1 hypothetical protein BD324DRAFT_647649 [Kockovaella imperatae]